MTALCKIFPYKGTGASRSFTGFGFQPDLVIIKQRGSNTVWAAFDSTRGATKYWDPASSTAETTDANTLTSFDSDGFSLGNASLVNASGGRYVAYCFKKSAGFLDIVSYSGTGSAMTVAHSLGSVPASMWVKRLDTSANSGVYHKSVNSGTTPEQYLLSITDNTLETASSTAWNNTAPTSSVFTVGTLARTNASGGTHIAYLWGDETSSSNQIAAGGFTTDGSGNATISLGFTPQAAIIKRVQTGASDGWKTMDIFRSWGSGSDDKVLSIDDTGAETTGTDYGGPGTNQFTVTGLAASIRYVYYAFITPMQVTDWFFPSTGASETISGGSSADWTNPGNITADDTSEAAWDVSSGTNATGPYLKGTDFASIDDTNLPPSCAIDGVEVCYRQRELSSTDNIFLSRVRLISGGTVQSTNFAGIDTATEWTVSSTEGGAVERIEGGLNEYGGLSLTDSSLKASDFGVALSVTHSTGTTPSCRVEYVKLRVFYTPVTSVSYSPNNGAHAHSSTAGTFSQSHVLAINNAAHAHSAAAGTFTQVHTYAPANAAHAHSATADSFSQNHVYAPANTAHAHSAGNATLLPDVSPNNCSHAHSAQNTAFSQVHTFAVSNAAHAHAATSGSFTQVHVLSSANAAHAHSAGNVTLSPDVSANNCLHAHAVTAGAFSQNHVFAAANAAHALSNTAATFSVNEPQLAANDCSHAHSSTSGSYAQVHIVTFANAAHAHSCTSSSFAQVHALTPADCSHAHAATVCSFTQVHVLSSSSAAHAHTSTSATFSQLHTLPVFSATHAHSAQNATFSQLHVISPANAAHAHAATGTSFEQIHNLTIANCAHALASLNASFAQAHVISPANAAHAHSAESVVFAQVHAFVVANAAQAVTSDEVLLESTGVYRPFPGTVVASPGSSRLVDSETSARNIVAPETMRLQEAASGDRIIEIPTANRST